MTLEEAFTVCEELYTVNIEGIDYCFRPLTRKEFRILLQSSPDGFDFEENVVHLCLIQPESVDTENCKAGFPAMLCLSILKVSGFCNAKESMEMIAAAKQELELDLDKQMECVIMTAFPQYKQEEIETWTRKKLFERYAQAEWSLNLKGLQIGFVDPNQQQTQVPPLPPPQAVPRRP